MFFHCKQLAIDVRHLVLSLQVERAIRLAEAARASEASADSKLAKAEEATRKLEGEGCLGRGLLCNGPNHPNLLMTTALIPDQVS